MHIEYHGDFAGKGLDGISVSALSVYGAIPTVTPYQREHYPQAFRMTQKILMTRANGAVSRRCWQKTNGKKGRCCRLAFLTRSPYSPEQRFDIQPASAEFRARTAQAFNLNPDEHVHA